MKGTLAARQASRSACALLTAQAGVGALVAVLQQRRAASEHGVREREQAAGPDSSGVTA